MSQSVNAGARIRERRLAVGLRQAELAQRAGVSASYLNLIEHNKRRIGGKTLLKLAEVLEVDASLLSDGVEASLVSDLHAAAGAHQDIEVEIGKAEELAVRFPGWAQLLGALHHEEDNLQNLIGALTDRMAHDPQLSASLHEVISTVTAIRSTASILVETKELEPEWQNRFHRNINEESRRLAEGAEALVRYLEAAPQAKDAALTPQDELHQILQSRGFHFPELEGGKTQEDVSQLAAVLQPRENSEISFLLQRYLLAYQQDALILPMEELLPAVEQLGVRPDRLLEKLQVPAVLLLRRLAAMPQEIVGPIGMYVCDVSGAPILRKPIYGFDLPRNVGACALWPVFQVLSTPQVPLRTDLHQLGLHGGDITAWSVAEKVGESNFGMASNLRGHMMLVPASAGREDVREVGVSCRICPRSDCLARRELSILPDGF